MLDLAGGWEAVYTERDVGEAAQPPPPARRQLGDSARSRSRSPASPSELAAALEEAFRLHAARWRDRPDASGFATPAGRRFHRDAIPRSRPPGVPRIALLRVGGARGRVQLLLPARRHACTSTSWPSTPTTRPLVARAATTLAAIEAAAAEGARRVEFLGGGERYKLELADGLEPLHQGIGLATTARGRAAAPPRASRAVHARRRLKETPVRRLYYDGLAPARRVARVTRSAMSARRGPSAPSPRPARTP